MSWATREGILRGNPLHGVRGPARPKHRRHHSVEEVRDLLTAAHDGVDRAAQALRQSLTDARRKKLFAAEQTQLMVRIAADSGARRGELAVLKISDIDGRVLTIERGLSDNVLGTTKSSRTRRLTLGATTIEMIKNHVARWDGEYARADGNDWLFSTDPARSSYI